MLPNWPHSRLWGFVAAGKLRVPQSERRRTHALIRVLKRTIRVELVRTRGRALNPPHDGLARYFGEKRCKRIFASDTQALLSN